MRPIYHYKSRRIKAHILICYISFALSRFVQKKVKTMSFEKIREELLQIESSIMEDKKSYQCYKVPSSMTEECMQIYKSMKVKRSILPTAYKS